MKNPLQFLREVRREAKKIAWANPKDSLRATMVVIAISGTVAFFFLLVDQLVKAALKFVLSLGL